MTFHLASIGRVAMFEVRFGFGGSSQLRYLVFGLWTIQPICIKFTIRSAAMVKRHASKTVHLLLIVLDVSDVVTKWWMSAHLEQTLCLVTYILMVFMTKGNQNVCYINIRWTLLCWFLPIYLFRWLLTYWDDRESAFMQSSSSSFSSNHPPHSWPIWAFRWSN